MGLCRFCGKQDATPLVVGGGEFNPKEGISRLPLGLNSVDEVGWPEYLDRMDQGCDDEENCPYKDIEHWHVSDYCSVECIGFQTDVWHGVEKND
ncbi:MAG TPA: hypothetical protein VKO18_09265 [Terriglobia bacterium]|nr:hypothetical protein [Terriglobia bacterium]